MNYISVLYKCIKFQINRESVDLDPVKNLTAEEVWEIFKLSKAHDLIPVVCASLQEADVLGDYKDVFEEQQFLAVMRYERMNYELDNIMKVFDEHNILYIPLKGAVMRKLYPEPWMRTSCDIDILVRENEIERATEVLKNELQYMYHGKDTHEISLITPSGIHIELHYKLNESGYKEFESLDNVWVTASQKKLCEYEMSDEVFYFYHIAHMAKHFKIAGCGIRFFVDLWMLDNCLEYSREKRDALLKKEGLLTFANIVRETAKRWFSSAEADNVTKDVEKFVVQGGAYGNMKNRVAIYQAEKGSKLKYILRRIFQPYNILKYRYPKLEKHKWMLPFYEVCRWCRLIKDGKLKQLSEEYNINKDIDEENIDFTKKLIEKIEL